MFKHTLLARDITIGYQHNAARDAVLSRQRHRFLHRCEQLRAAATALLFNQTNRASDVLLVRLQRLRRKHRSITGKENYVEQVSRPQVSDQVFEQPLGRVQRKTFHRARNVNDEDVLARRNSFGRNARGRLGHVKKVILIRTLE